jgi:hypothetical protein
MADDTGDLTHAPAPSGLPGGYPVRVDGKGGQVVLPPELTLEQAIRINEEGQRYDGIDKIDQDGTVHFTENASTIIKEMMGYECTVMKLEESEERARELGAKFEEFVRKHR